MSRYVPLLLGERGRTLRSPSASTLQRKARKPAKRSNPKRGNPKRKKTTKKAATKKRKAPKKKAATKKAATKKRATKRGGVVKPTRKNPLTGRTLPQVRKAIKWAQQTGYWPTAPAAERRKILEEQARKLSFKQVWNHLAFIEAGLHEASPAELRRIAKELPKIKSALSRDISWFQKRLPGERATRTNPRRNHHTTKAGRGKYAQVCMKIYGPIKSKAATLKNPATKRRPDLDQWVKRAGDPVEVIETLRDYQLKLVGTGNFRAAEAVQRDVEYLRKKYKVKRSAIRGWGTRANPGRLAILANPLPKEVEESAAKMRGEKRRRFLAYYASLKAGDQKRLIKGLRLYKRRHKVPCTDFELKRVKGARPDIEVGVGRAQAIEYHANKGYQGSSKRGTPFRHEFENNQHVVSDENGRALKVVDARGAKRRTITTDWIYN